ncbi:DNA gyrase subunit A [Arthrobacter globiformis]|nr:DNA gyrase subunit A [Arthrobacter globiformis]
MDEDERQIRQELMILDALVQAMDRRDEVFQMIENSEDRDEAIRRVGQLLGVGELGSRAVLDLQARRFTRDQRHALALRAEELRSTLPDGR